MIIIKEKESINKVWRKVLNELYKKGFIPRFVFSIDFAQIAVKDMKFVEEIINEKIN